MMTKKIKIIFLFVCYTSFFTNAQSNQENQKNDTKVLKISRTSSEWNEIIAFPVRTFIVPENTTKYIHIDVYYDKIPDIGISVDAADENSDGTEIIRPLTTYTNVGEWQTLVFPIEAKTNVLQVNALLIYPDIGQQNASTSLVLDSLNNFGYLDNITLKNTATLANENSVQELTTLRLSPNPAAHHLKINSSEKISRIMFYDKLGKNVTHKITNLNNDNFEIENLSSGLYFVKIEFRNGTITSRKFIKK